MLAGEDLVLEVKIDGQGPYRFGLDTGGAGGGRIDKALAETLKLKGIGQVIGGDPSGKNAQTLDVVEAGTLTLGGATWSGVHLVVRDLSHRDLDGILGFGLFKDFLLTLDYPARRVRIEKGELPPADGREVLGFEEPEGVPQIRLKIGELEIPADVDSGNVNGELVLPSSYLDKVPLESEPKVVGRGRTGYNEFEIKRAPLKGSVQVGSLTIDRPHVDFIEIFPHANVGQVFLRRFAVTIDQKNHRIRFKLPASTASGAPSPNPPSPPSPPGNTPSTAG
jgi:aspartyl protease